MVLFLPKFMINVTTKLPNSQFEMVMFLALHPMESTLNRSYMCPPYIFCACSESKNRSYNILILYKIQGYVETLQIMSFQNDW